MDCRETTRLGTVQHEVKAPLRRLPAVGDLDFDAILSTHLTIGMLLHRVPSGVCLEFICECHPYCKNLRLELQVRVCEPAIGCID